MKAISSFVCLAMVTSTSMAFDLTDGVDAYRLGEYVKASGVFQDSPRHDPVEEYYLGRMRLYGYGMLKNDATAIKHFTQSAERGYLPAQNLMAHYTLLVKNDPTEALKWFKKAADLDDTQAQLYCAGAYLFGFGTKRNPDVARRYYIGAAKNGNALAQATLAAHFLDSRHASNKKLGLIWLNKALEQQDPKAQVLMAAMQIKGDSQVAKDIQSANSLLDAAIKQNYLPAFYQKGRLALEEQKYTEARDWFTKASENHYSPANTALAKLFLMKNTPLHDEHQGFLWMLKAAQGGSKEARLAVANMYKNGIGIEANENLAKEWQDKAKKTPKQQAKAKMLKWLSHGKATNFDMAGYRLTGILGAWNNPSALKENDYNPAPQMNRLTREALYQPRFVLTKPTDIPISDYYAAYLETVEDLPDASLIFPHYPLAYASSTEKLSEEAIEQLASRAVLGDATIQFELAQRYQYGGGVEKNMEQAIEYYKMAALQRDLRAIYSLGIIYLEGIGVPQDIKQGLAYLNDAAFKGNRYAEYVLGRLYEQGFNADNGSVAIKPDMDRAIGMYNLASSNQYGLAQFRLAELMIHQQKQSDISKKARVKRHQMIKSLYQGALAGGVKEAALPLAFYNAIDKDPNKQKEAFDVALKAAGSGSSGGILLVGLMYDKGLGTSANHDEALYWYKKAPKNPIVAFILGTEMSLGHGISQNKAEGRRLLEKASAAGFPYADLNLAIMKHQAGEEFITDLDKARLAGNSKAGLLLADYYLAQAGDEKDMKQAREIYHEFAKKGSAEGQLKLGYMSEQGLGGKLDKAGAQSWYHLSAQQGQPVAQYLLARLYQLGWPDNKPNYETAKQWYAKAQAAYLPAAVALGFIQDAIEDDYGNALRSYQGAASKGDPVGLFNLGLIYEEGKGCPVNVEKAKQMYLAAAQKGHPQAMRQLGGLYFNGLLGKRDDEKGLMWYKKAAKYGDRDALYQLGLFFETGVATPVNNAEAVNYYQMAADKGHVKAKLALARMYRHGIGVAKDPAKAEKIYQSLADQNNPYAQYQLALFYYDGASGEAKPDKGKRWLQQAAKNGSVQAEQALQRMEAERKNQVSYIKSSPVFTPEKIWRQQTVARMYFDALSALNAGDESNSKYMLTGIRREYPNYQPAKQVCDQFSSLRMMFSTQAKG